MTNKLEEGVPEPEKPAEPERGTSRCLGVFVHLRWVAEAGEAQVRTAEDGLLQ